MSKIKKVDDCIVQIDCNGDIIELNKTAGQIFGCSVSKAIGLNLSSFAAPCAPYTSALWTREQIQVAIDQPIECIATQANGAQFNIESVITPLNTDNKIFNVLFRPVTTRKHNNRAVRESEAQLRFVFGILNVGHWDMDLKDFTVRRSLRHANIFGYNDTSYEWSWEIFLNHVLPEYREDVRLQFETALERQEDWSFECQILRRDNNIRWIHAGGRHYPDEHGKIYRVVGIVEDITERKHAEDERALATLVYENSQEAMMVIDDNINIIAVNPTFTLLTGYSATEAIGKNLQLLYSKIDNAHYKELWHEVHCNDFWKGEILGVHKNGDTFPEILTINKIKSSGADSKNRFVALFTDISQKKASEEMMWHQANFDTLTNLPNRHMFYEQLSQAIKRANRTGSLFALLFIDLDRFKEINDTLGHHIGDLLLDETAQRIRNSVRETDSIARLGGDEFTVILSDIIDEKSVDIIVSHIIAEQVKPYMISEVKLFVSASIGVAIYPKDAKDSATLLKYADQAMYEAKAEGRNCHKYFTSCLQLSSETRMRLRNDLYEALTRKQFRIYYQPIIDLNSNTIYKAEALIRWQHPTLGLIGPEEFIPLAEETGLIIDIGNWVFQQSAQQVKRWQKLHDPHFQISVNKSPAQFRNGESQSLKSWLSHIQELELLSNSIAIEVTERILIDNAKIVSKNLQQFRTSGMQISLDDFGTGYSSLSYLRKFNIDYLKIDRAFVANLEDNKSDFILCEAIVDMAHKLQLKVIAEGVETEAQYQILRGLGCDFAQGFLFSKAVPEDEFNRNYPFFPIQNNTEVN